MDSKVVEAALHAIPRETALMILAVQAGGRGLYEIREEPETLKAVLDAALAARTPCPTCGR